MTSLLQRISTLALSLSYASYVLAQNATNNGNATTVTLAPTRQASDCSCGFLDPNTTRLYTDSIIVYFNETSSIPKDVFSVQSFSHAYEKGWYTYYREGALPQNAFITAGDVWNLSPSWLNLNISGYTPQHLVNGAGLQTVRQDIQYGTFRVFMRSPQPYAGGSALSMMLQYNETESVELDLFNQDDSTDDAYVGTYMNDEFLNVEYETNTTLNGVNYTTLEGAGYLMGPWDFWEYRLDWTKDKIDWYMLPNLTRTSNSSIHSLPSTPAPFTLKHWSNGDADGTQGPPQNDTTASVGWVRLFFNSSLTNESDWAAGCSTAQACSTEDMTIRGSTDYSTEATLRWSPATFHHSKSRDVAIALCSVALAFSAALILHAVIRKVTSRKYSPYETMSPVRPKDRGLEMQSLRPETAGASSSNLLLNSPSSATLVAPHPRPNGRRTSSTQMLLMDLNRQSNASFSTTMTPGWITPGRTTPMATPGLFDKQGPWPFLQNPDANRTVDWSDAAAERPSQPRQETMSSAVLDEGAIVAANPGAKVPIAQVRTRVDYLAGLVAVCSLLVSGTHFILTYVPAVDENYLPEHYKSEYWARRTVEPFFFNEIWVGIFFTTSTRFLITGYLRNGNLKGIAEKVVCRCPRLMIPITAVIIFEYFMMNLGATTYLEYIPSITWSTWPSTTLYTDFGYFIDETLQLLYLIPNAAPQITWNYATGVLWTIPVQLQNTWTVLLGVVIIKEIKNPWKRFGYYAFCIVNNWYALSWGSYFWAGLLLADLDITYKYRKWVSARFYVHYPMLTLASILVFVSLGNDLLSVWSPTNYTFSTSERGIHPEVESALPLAQTADAGYPPYVCISNDRSQMRNALAYIDDRSSRSSTV